MPKFKVKIYEAPIIVELEAEDRKKAELKAVRSQFYKWREEQLDEVTAELKEIEFTADCPSCDKENKFIVTGEELKEDFDFTCSECKKSFPLSKYDGSVKYQSIME